MEAKKKAQLDLLRVMAENEEEKERRLRDYRNPYIPTPVPPPFKTAGQRRAEGVEQERLAITNLTTLGDLSTTEMLFVVNAIRRSDESEGIVKFNAFFPQIKNRLLRSVNPAFLTGNYLANWIVDYIRRSDTINPLAYNQSGEMLQSSFADATNINPNYDMMAEFKDIVFAFSRQLLSIPSIDQRVASEVEDGLEQLSTLLEVIPRQKDLNEVREKASSVELEDFAKFLQAYYQNIGSIDSRVIASLSKDIVEKMDMGIISQLESLGRVVIRRLKGIKGDMVLQQQHGVYLARVENIVSENKEREELLRDYQEQTPIMGDMGEGGTPTQSLQRELSSVSRQTSAEDPVESVLSSANTADEILGRPDPLGAEEEEDGLPFVSGFSENNIGTYVEAVQEEIEELDDLGKATQVKAIVLIITEAYNSSRNKIGSVAPADIKTTQSKYSASKAIVKFMDEEQIQMFMTIRSKMYDFASAVEAGIPIEEAYETILLAFNEDLPETFDDDDTDKTFIDITMDLLENYMKAKKKAKSRKYNPTAVIDATTSKNDRDELRGVDYTQSGSKYKYNLKRGFGVRNRMAVRPAVMPPTYKKPLRTIDRQQLLKKEAELSKVKKGKCRVKVGNGIQVITPEVAYKSFGKHILHYPQLRDTNTLNIKYPSGTKNYIKKQIISNDYKDLIMDILERGKMSDGLYDRLVDDEKQHFSKIVKGAGLMEQLKVKPPKDKNMKVLAERFKILRGQFLAGNNAPTLMEELKKIIVIFMENGVLGKEDGKDLLKEIK
tara:strand:+ start:378 stop:2708 length:2331 start_codon:yes stop_codon:yes gene_type:complete